MWIYTYMKLTLMQYYNGAWPLLFRQLQEVNFQAADAA